MKRIYITAIPLDSNFAIYAALSGSKSSVARLPQERITVG